MCFSVALVMSFVKLMELRSILAEEWQVYATQTKWSKFISRHNISMIMDQVEKGLYIKDMREKNVTLLRNRIMNLLVF